MDDKPLFQGIFVPVITPFTIDNKIHEQGIRNILDHLHSNGISGVWLMGSYGSFPLLSEEERIQVAEKGLAAAPKNGMTTIVNVGSLNTAMAVRLAKHAEQNGAHGVASVVPFYYAASHYREHNFLGYFKEIIRSVRVPVFFYNNEKATGFKPSLNFFLKMLEIGISGFKSKGDYLEMSEQIRLLRKHAPAGIYLSGTTSVHLQGHLLGANGVTSGVALVMPHLVVSLQKALENNDITEALRLQDLVLKARTIMGRYVGRAVSCYDILLDRGLDVGTCRSPWFRMESAQTREVIRELKILEEAV